MTNQVNTGRVVREVFDIYRDQAGVLLPAALVVFAVEGLIRGVLTAASPFLAILGFIVSLTAVGLYRGMVVQLVADLQDGRRDSSVGDLFRSVVPVLVPLILASLLFGLGVGIGLVLLIVPGLILATIWAVVSPVVVLEQPGVIAAFERSRKLVRGNAGPVFGVIVVFAVIFIVVALILSAIGAALGPVGTIIAGIISSVLTAPLLGLAGTVLYFELLGPGGVGAPERGAAGVGAGAGAGGPAVAPAPQPSASPGAPPGHPTESPRSPAEPSAPGRSASGPQSPAASPDRPSGEPGSGRPA